MNLTAWQSAQDGLRASPRQWLLSGVAGFVGSHLLEKLLNLEQFVVGLDNLSSGSRRNLSDVEQRVGPKAWLRFRFVEGDLLESDLCRELCAHGPLVLHQAALGSIPRSLEYPGKTFESNVRGFFNLLDAARRGSSPAFVYASSSSVYGDHPELPRCESVIGDAISPYAGFKRIDEIMAQTAWRSHGQPNVGLRYFNVFGPRQDPSGAYSAVIPRWAQSWLAGELPTVHGDGSTTRDFCPVSCVVQANLLAALAGEACQGQVFNVALGKSLTLLELFACMGEYFGRGTACEVPTGPFRKGDVRHSLADLTRIRAALAYQPEESFRAALKDTLAWYAARQSDIDAGSAGRPV